jgi:3'-phosphoadenosine 5'-phosphosulfate sulfotransferase (PAPS reductase)/FAD synthetase
MAEEELHPLQLTAREVAAYTGSQRERRVLELMERSREITELGERAHVDGHRITGRVALYSGGDDSTALVHLMRPLLDAAAHANTTIGIEETRVFVRETSAAWNLPLVEKYPPASYRELVLEQGFPGPAQHFKMYQRLKERCLRQVRAEFVTSPRRERVVFFAGRRRDESQRRADVPMHERQGSTIWISPLIEWTKLDLNTYRLMMGDVPRNPVSAVLHMSGECLCGSFAKQYELAQIAEWFPLSATEITELEAEIADREDIPLERRKWGWGAWRNVAPELLNEYRAKLGPMCSACAVVSA